MSLERVLKILESLGLQRADAEMYIYLAKKGPKREQELFRAFKMTDAQLRSSLENLQTRGVVTATLEQSALFSAVAFERALDLLIRVNIEHAQIIKETKKEILKNWQTMEKRDPT